MNQRLAGGKFTRFNYGAEGNLERYGTVTPPVYSMKDVTAPVYLLWGQTDGVVAAEVINKPLHFHHWHRVLSDFDQSKDVEWLASSLANLKGSIRVNASVFSHGDFFMSKNVSELVHKPLLALLPPP